MPLTPSQNLALALLKTIEERTVAYDAVNEQIKKLQGDFPSVVQDIDQEINSAVFKLLDTILGDEIASYYFWEARGMENGRIIENGKEWPIRNLDDVRAFVARNRS